MFNSRCQHFKRVTLSTAQSPGSTCSSYQIADVATLSKTPHKRVKWLPIYSPPAQGLTHIQTWHAAHTLHMHAHALLVQQGANAVTPSRSMSTVPQDKGEPSRRTAGRCFLSKTPPYTVCHKVSQCAVTQADITRSKLLGAALSAGVTTVAEDILNAPLCSHTSLQVVDGS